ncbi:MAG: hypothetical protein RMJ06_06675 [Nitrososphaerota archaeon]|nr:hypothetical protein [Nitrososphaerota archaeon]
MGATPYGLVFYAVISLLLYAFMAAKIKSVEKSKEGKVAALAIAFALGFLFIGPLTANIVQPFIPVPLVSQGLDVNLMTEEGSLKIVVNDAMTGAPVTSGKLYLAKGSYDINAFDDIKKGRMKAGADYLVLPVGTDGSATFNGVTGSTLGTTYTVFYEPSSFANNGYPLYSGRVVVYPSATGSGVLRGSGAALMLYKNSPCAVFDPTGTARGSYTMNTLNFDLAARVGPTTQNSAVQNVYLYLTRDDTKMIEFNVYIGGQEATFVKLANLESSNPLLKNAPSGTTHVATAPVIPGPMVFDEKTDIRIKGTANANTAVTLTFVQNANVETADVTLGTFTVTVNTSGSPGWGS